MDMFLPLFPLRYLEVQGLAESTLGNDIREICQKAGVEVQADKEPDRNLFIRSDQYSFIRQGVPALAFKFGYLEGSPEETTAKNWLQTRYHAPSDDLNQPVDTAAAAKSTAFCWIWGPGSPMRRIARNGAPIASSAGSPKEIKALRHATHN